MLTKSQIVVIYLGIFAMLILTSVYEAVLQLSYGVLTIDLWFLLVLMIFLIVDVIIEYRIEDKKLRLIHDLILSSIAVIVIVLIVYKFLQLILSI